MTLREAMAGSEANDWQRAMSVEHEALLRNKTWKLVPRPKGRRVVGVKWVFKKKYKGDGSLEHYKARLVAKGFTQVKGADFNETFAPVARMTSLRTLLAIAAAKGYQVEQMDVDNAYLNAEADVDIYMEQPPGYEDCNHPDHVCLLDKSLYGLKQAGRLWHEHYKGRLLDMGFKQSIADPCIFVRTTKKGELLIGVYVDDTVKAGHSAAIAEFNTEISQHYGIKELGPIKFLLAIQINQDENGISLCQSTYIKKLAEEEGLADHKPVYTPISGGAFQELDMQSEPVDAKVYRHLIGRLMYAMVGTRPDIAFTVGALAKYASKPTKKHLDAARRLVAYLHTTADYCITYHKNSGPPTLTGYCDASWGNDLTDRKSIAGYIFLLNGSPISWASKKQTTTALSSTEAEYISASQATRETIYLCRLLKDLGCEQTKATVIHKDNQRAIAISRNPCFHNRTKHIDIQHHFVREKTEDGTVQLEYCATSEQLADILTKPLDGPKHHSLTTKLGLRTST